MRSLESIRLIGAACTLVAGGLILSCLAEIDWPQMRNTRLRDGLRRAPWRPAFVSERGRRRLAVALPLLGIAIVCFWWNWFAK